MARLLEPEQRTWHGSRVVESMWERPAEAQLLIASRALDQLPTSTPSRP